MKSILNEFLWLSECLQLVEQRNERFQSPPSLSPDIEGDAYGAFVFEHGLDWQERLLLVLGLAQYFDATLLRALLDESNSYALIQCNRTGLLQPTGETFLKLVAGEDFERKIGAHRFLDTAHLFYRKSVVDFGQVSEGAASYFGIIKITNSFRDLFLYNRHNRPRFSNDFPAQLLETKLEWGDLVLNPSTEVRIAEIKAYLQYNDQLRETWGLKKHIRPGYRCLFHGPSGTGKTLAATLLGKHVGRDVYRVDLSSVVSKYIGETSKNLNALFNRAEDKDWILFFDEGDALFGKRVDTAQAEDKNSHFANQDTAFLLQRIESYNGLVIVATNFKKNMDEAFQRRFQCVIHFDLPSPENRHRIWKETLPEQCSLDPRINLEHISRQHMLSAASIVNIVNRVSLLTMSHGSNTIGYEDFDKCIKDELYK